MNDLTDKVAVVTGASKGIGAAIAKSLAAAGASVAVNYASSREGANRVVAEIESRGGRALAVQGDVSQAADVKRLFEETTAAFGPVDILVNNAGIFKFAPIEDVTEEDFHSHFNTNVLGPILTTQEALKHFPPSGGSIVNISSPASTNPSPSGSVYAASKAALDALTKSFAKALGPKNIRVNTVAPGPTETEGVQQSGLIGSEMEKTIIAATPLGRFGQPNDIAPVVTFLVSDAAAWVTGERIGVTGGLG